MPMHSVCKATSTTTKLRVVFDASAKTTTGLSYNDTLAAGPMLHSNLDQILIRFRWYRVALTGDIQKMYKEIMLSPPDQNYHRFLWRAQLDESVSEYCMERVTFGVTSSPYVAVQSLRQAAVDFGQDCVEAVQHIKRSFYVDDLLGGSDTVEGALALQKDLSAILTKAGFTLRKFRSSSDQVLGGIPQELVEPMPRKELVDCHNSRYPKALGLRWDSVKDTMSVDVDTQAVVEDTKRGLLSDISRTFDVLGWINPVILPMKLLMQELWHPEIKWDDPMPEDLKVRHRVWREELSELAELELPRSYFAQEAAEDVCIHGFSDASDRAYGAVMYIRATYRDHPPTVQLVLAKSKVVAIKEKRTTPELELCGAVLLLDMMKTVQQTLDVEPSQVRAWSDSTTVLCWLQSVPTKYKIFVGNRITTANEYFPPSIWGLCQRMKILQTMPLEECLPKSLKKVTYGGKVPAG